MTKAEFVRVATVTFKTALTLINPGLRARLNAVNEWAAEIFPTQPDYEIPQRDLQRQFDSAIDRSSKYLENLSRGPEYSEVSSGDVTSALLAATQTVEEASQFLTADQLLRRALTPTDVTRLMTPALEARLSKADIADGAERLARLMLDVCCYELVNWAVSFPPIQNLASWTTLANSMSLVKTTQEILQDLRRTGLPQAREPDRIITAQRRDVASLLGKMELFGLPVEARYRLIPISVSYVMAVGSVPSSKHRGNYPFTEIVTGALIGRGRRRYMNQSLRLLIVGGAGSGKTTAAQWLTYQCAIGTLGDLSPVFSSTIPIFVRLRRALDNDQQMPPDSALIMSGQLRDTLGPDWIEALSGRYQPLIVLDGWDEVRVGRRPLASAWLKSLAERFPHGHIVVTTRPDGGGDPIFDELDFHRANLTPLNPSRRLQLVDRWFDGLRANLAQSPELDNAYLADAQSQIVRDFSSPLLADVADTPLFTAMLCCLYATTRMRGPQNRGSLFQMVANALIHYRDEQQEVHTGVWNDLELGHKEIILGEIAVKMAEGGLLELPQRSASSSADTLDGIVEQVLPSFGLSASHKDTVSESMLNRCIVLRPVGDSAVEFVHRTFQDYFAGSLLARRGDAAKLFSLTQDDERLLSMLPFAAYVAGERTASEIVTWLLRATRAPDKTFRKQILHMIVECLGAAKQLEPKLRNEAIAAVESLFPPSDLVEARALSRLSDAAVGFLKADLWPEKYDEYCIDALVRIGTTRAIDALAQYARLRGESNVERLAVAWDRISDPGYPRVVLSEIPIGLHLVIKSKDRLRQIGGLRGTSTIECESVDMSDESIEILKSLPHLKSLSVTNCNGGIGDSVFADINCLLQLDIINCTSTAKIGHIGPAGLQAMILNRVMARDFDWMSILGICSRLSTLRLMDVQDLDVHNMSYAAFAGAYGISIVPDQAIALLRDLRILDISHSKYGGSIVYPPGISAEGRLTRDVTGSALTDVGFASRCTGIRVLRISDPLSSSGMENLAVLQDLRELDVTLAGGGYKYATSLPMARALVRLVLNGGGWFSAGDLTGCPRLQSVKLRHCNIGSIASLRLPRKLLAIELENCYATTPGAKGKDSADASCASSLEVVGGVVDNLDFLARFPELKRLVVRDVMVTDNVSGICFVPDDCEISIEGLPEEIDDTPIEELREEQRCLIQYERRPKWEDQFDSGGS